MIKKLSQVLVASVTIASSVPKESLKINPSLTYPILVNNQVYADTQYAKPPPALDNKCGDMTIEKARNAVPNSSLLPAAEKIAPGIASDPIRGFRSIQYRIAGYDIDQKPNASLDYFGKDFGQLDMVVLSDADSGYKFGTFFKYGRPGPERFIFYGQSRVGNTNFLLFTCKPEWNLRGLDDIISNINALPLMIPPTSPNSPLPQTKTKKI